MNKDHKDLIPKNTVVPFEQINHTFFINPLPNDEIKSVSLLFLDSISPGARNARWHLWEKLSENRNAELTTKIPLILELIFPKVLEKIILEYLIDNEIDKVIEKNNSPLSLERWLKLTWSRDFKFPENKHFLNFPYEDEKLQHFTKCLVEEKQYRPKH